MTGYISQSLSRKALFSVVIICIPVLATFWIGHRATKRHFEKLISTNLIAMTEAYEGQLHYFLEISRQRNLDYANEGIVVNELRTFVKDRKTFSGALRGFLVERKRVAGKSLLSIYIASLDGRILASTGNGSVGTDVSSEVSFRKGKSGIYLVDEGKVIDGLPVISVSAPVVDSVSGSTLGVVVSLVSIDEVSRIFTGDYAGERSIFSIARGRTKTLEAYLVSREGFMLTPSIFIKDAILKQKVNTRPVELCNSSNDEMQGAYMDYRGIEVMGASVCMPSLGWTLLVEIDRDEVLSPLDRMIRDAIILSIILAGITVIFFIVLRKMVIGPLEDISSAARQVASGEYDVKIPVRTSDEVGRLSSSFNTLANSIKSSTAVLKENSEALRKSKARLASANRIARLGNWEWDIVNNRLYWSDEIYNIFGIPPQSFQETYEAFLNTVHPDDREFVMSAVNRALAGEDYSIDHRIVRPDGVELTVHEQAETTFDESGKAVRMFGTVQDVTMQRMADFELKRLQLAIEQSVNIIFMTDAKGKIEYVNPMFEQVTGWKKEEVLGKNPKILSSGETSKRQYLELWETITSGKTWRGSFKNKKKNGEFYWGTAVISPIRNERGEITNFLAVQEDITERKKAEERMQFLAYYDEMTGLLNRSRYIELMCDWIKFRSERDDGGKGVFLLIDIDEFKFINDTYGHGVGDEMLRRLADVIVGTLRDFDLFSDDDDKNVLASRLGGDEFAVFIPYVDQNRGLEVADQIRKRFHEQRLIGGNLIATLSVSVSLYPEHAKTTKELFIRADAAMFRAKSRGRNRCHIYRPEDRDLERLHTRLNEKAMIQKALEEARFVPWFQPILSVADNMVHHYEALVRLKEAETIILPSKFISTAEKFGLIGAIDRVVTEKTMRIQGELGRSGKHLSISMNLSGKNLGDEELLSYLQEKIHESGADPKHLIFEITETAAVGDLDRAIKFIDSLKSMGCKFSLDDFGVGFTSFVYLREMQVDYIKIDGSFIRQLHENKSDQLFVRAMIEVARGMGIRTIAEFVENEAVLQLLREYGVDYAQGYHIGRPQAEIK